MLGDVLPYFEFVGQDDVNAGASQIFEVLLDMNSWDRWWPGHLNKIEGDERVVKKDSIVDITLRGYTPINIKLVAKFTDIVENKSIKAEWGGDLVGPVEWTLGTQRWKNAG